jgi:DNA-binding MarR family transcriptional regulator
MKNFRPNELLAEHKSVFKQAPELDALGVAHTQGFPGSGHDALLPSPDQLTGLAKRLYAGRSRRKDFLTPELFGEPGWDMLLALFNAEAGGNRLTVSSLCAASLCPETTALRWLDRLGQLDLVRRVKHPLDGRVFFIDLQPAARSSINSYLREMWASLFAPN